MENTPIPIPHFEPWKKYPSLAPERLTIFANLISDVRHQAVLAHEPGVGDTNWGLGTRVYERTCFGLETAAPEYPIGCTFCRKQKACNLALRSVQCRSVFIAANPTNRPTDTTFVRLANCIISKLAYNSKACAPSTLSLDLP